MALIDILTDIAIEIGKAGSDGDTSARIYRINKAAEELHDANDFDEALEEKIFNFNVGNAQTITLPAYVYKVRGARYSDSRLAVTIEDMRNRYNFAWLNENETWYLKPRYKGTSPLSREINNQSTLILKIPIADTTSFTVVVTGETDKSNRISETLTFSAGTLEKETVNNYISVESIVKSRITTYDIIIYDVENNEIGRILNSEYQSYFTLWQILDEESGSILPTDFSGVEVLYKKKFQPFKNNEDCFLGSSRYDKAIFWKFMEHRTKDNKEMGAFNLKCIQVLSQIYEGDNSSKRRRINFRPSPYFNMPYEYSRHEYYHNK